MDDLKKNESSDCRIPNMLHKEERTCHVSSEEANAPRLQSVMNSGDELSIEKGTSSCPLLIRPITPSPVRGSSILCNRDILTSTTSDAGKAPWSLSSSSSSFLPETTTSLSNNEECDDVDNDSPHTPQEMVFDPFAPGPEYLACAPIRRHMGCRKEFKDLCRRLSFGGDSCFDDDDDEGVGRDIDVKEKESVLNVEEISEEMILECLYETLLETMLGKETKEGGVAAEMKQCDELKDFFVETPPCTILGVREYSSFNYCDANGGDTCPGAPMKAAVRKARNVEAVRRRLEF